MMMRSVCSVPPPCIAEPFLPPWVPPSRRIAAYSSSCTLAATRIALAGTESRVTWDAPIHSVDDIGAMPIVLGRSVQATYCITDARVSRSHARIDWQGSSFELTDLSYNGTYVRFGDSGELLSLKRGSCTLHGSGVIGLGGLPTDEQSPIVRFEVLHFADTEPQQPFGSARSRR